MATSYHITTTRRSAPHQFHPQGKRYKSNQVIDRLERCPVHPPLTHLGSHHTLLVLVDGKAGAGHGELDDEDDEEHDHVEEQHHLEHSTHSSSHRIVLHSQLAILVSPLDFRHPAD